MKLEDEVKKYLGIAPHNQPSNFLIGDGYFYKSLVDEYGSKAVNDMISKLK